MRIAAFDDARIGVVANDDTVVDVTDLLQPYEPLGPEDLLPDLAMVSRLTTCDFVRRLPVRRKSSV